MTLQEKLMSCIVGVDSSLGPRVDPACREFDFTLAFEDVVFVCVPAALFIVPALAQIALLWRKQAGLQRELDKFVAVKLLAFIAALATQLAVLGIRLQTTALATGVSLAGNVLSSVATTAAAVLSFTSYRKSYRPSTLLALYLSAVVVLGIARARTFWLITGSSSASASLIASLAMLLSALFLESLPSKPLDADVVQRQGKTPELYSGFWNRITFSWLATTFWAGYSRIISVNDLPGLDPKLHSHALHDQISLNWNKGDKKGKYAILRTCIRTFWPSLVSTIIPRLCVTVFNFSQPFLVNTTLSYVGASERDANYGRGLIGAWLLVYLGIAVSNSVYSYQNLRFSLRIRGALIALVFQHNVNTRPVDMGGITGATLMGTDVERIVSGIRMFNELWGSLLDVAVASWLLERQLSLACLAPIALILVFVGITSKVSASAGTSQRQWVEKVQERLRVTTAVLGDMKSVKLLGLPTVLSNMIAAIRVDEIDTSEGFRKIIVATILLSLTPINFAPIVTFAVYVMISLYWKDGTLLTAQAFTAVALIGLLVNPVIAFIQTLPNFLQTTGCFGRIQEYCNYADTAAQAKTPSLDSDSNYIKNPDINDCVDKFGGFYEKNDSVRLQDYFGGETFAWKDKGANVLTNIHLPVLNGGINVISGPTASGKSALLTALLGEMAASTRSQSRPIGGSVAYCAQNPWLENGTIRESILGVSEYDPIWYNKVVWACGLDVDLANAAKKDQFRIGSGGLNLSGGQKHRIALARAVYSRHKTILLDNVFSSLDAQTSSAVRERLLGANGLIRQHMQTVFLVSNDHGHVLEFGSYLQLSESDGYIGSLKPLGNNNPSPAVTDKTLPSKDEAAVPPRIGISGELEDGPGDSGKGFEDLRRKNGDASVYKYYFASAGYLIIGVNVFFMLNWTVTTELSSIWIKWWSEANEKQPNEKVGMYLGVYAALGVLAIVGACMAAWTALIPIISKSAVKLHSDVLETTMRAPLRFFSTTDSGEILNRFSQDMELIDMELPSTMINYSSTAFTCAAKVIIIAIFSKYLGIAIPLMGISLFFLQKFYLQTSRQLRHLSIEAKAPLYTSFTAVSEGLITIRAFGWESQYQDRCQRLIDASQRPEYMLSCIQYCLGFVLELLTAALAVALVTITITLADQLSAGSVGVALVMVIGLSEVLVRLIKSWTRLETSIGAAARVKRYITDTESEVAKTNVVHISAQWPEAGCLEIKNLTASYTADAEPALNNISLSVQAGQHIAVCGRTGSGKSSIILSILQMIDTEPAGAITIDGVDVSAVDPTQLRQRINIVSQDAFLFPGTIRLNLNPFSSASDDAIISALERVGLWSMVQEKGGLEADMDDKVWSAGQKQLFCLARALIRKSKVLFLDEAMSSVDASTERIAHDIISTDFKGCTVLSIIHRLSHIHAFDRVAVMAEGSLIEYDEPAKLLGAPSRFAELYAASNQDTTRAAEET
ncbi:ABC transporter, transmembrane domain, type 1 [Metarhizium rileyi]|uniref:ABC transporter, transmembrane domain, type 1 n=1 Tax=Metarhizium rileyi (strain RCEF 4871) TaxID=1649241 RepID=A0A166XW30_METRR|nr:ABC transporter, transmembrane domain, type 1 [Metarhizium rileyi RCEF 4871]